MIKMHGFFDLKEGQVESDFAAAYERFATDLMAQKLIVASRSMRRRPDPNYDSSPPETKYYISMDFIDMTQAQCPDVALRGAFLLESFCSAGHEVCSELTLTSSAARDASHLQPTHG